MINSFLKAIRLYLLYDLNIHQKHKSLAMTTRYIYMKLDRFIVSLFYSAYAMYMYVCVILP